VRVAGFILGMVVLWAVTTANECRAFTLAWANGQADIVVNEARSCTLYVMKSVPTETLPKQWDLVWGGDGRITMDSHSFASTAGDAFVNATLRSGEHPALDLLAHSYVAEVAGESPAMQGIRIVITVRQTGPMRLAFVQYVPEDSPDSSTYVPELTINGGVQDPLPAVPFEATPDNQAGPSHVLIKGAFLRETSTAYLYHGSQSEQVELTITEQSDKRLSVYSPSMEPVDGDVLLLMSKTGGIATVTFSDPAPRVPDSESESHLLVRFQPGEVEPEAGTTGGMLSSFTVRDAGLRDSLETMGVTRLERLLPSFRHEDVNALNPLGEPVILQDLADLYVVYLRSGTEVQATSESLDVHAGILYSESDPTQNIALFPNDELYSDQWDLNASGQTICGAFTPDATSDINAPEAWLITTGSPTVPVAVLDSGIDNTHDDLENRVTVGPGQSFVSPVTATAADDAPDRHGTAVAGIIGATGDNQIGIAGINWNVPLKAVKITTGAGTGQPSWLGQGIEWVRTHNVPIANMSVGFKAGGFSTIVGTMQALNDICYNAFQQGVLLVASMGNDDEATALYPAAFSRRVCAVGATWLNGTRWTNDAIVTGEPGGSNFGPWIDLVAPGGATIVTLEAGPDHYKDLSNCSPDNFGSMAFGGTSAAAPVVSGVASLLRSVPLPAGTVLLGEDLQKIMELTALRPGGQPFNQFNGWGIVKADLALAFINPATKMVHQGSLGAGGTEGVLIAAADSGTVPGLTFINVPGLTSPFNCSSCVRYHMRGTASFGYTQPPVVWTRSSGTEGWKDTTSFDYNYEVRSARVTAAPTASHAVLETAVYRIPGVGWFPTTPAAARIAYTAVGNTNPVGVGPEQNGIVASLRIAPNPSIGRSAIHLTLRKTENITVAIYDVAGRKIADLWHAALSEGAHVLPWAGVDERGVKCRAGVYWVKVAGPETRMQTSLVLIRAGGS
jgi:subtilisin family serine protease